MKTQDVHALLSKRNLENILSSNDKINIFSMEESKVNLLNDYLEILFIWSKKIDLISKSSKESILYEHILDSVIAANVVSSYLNQTSFEVESIVDIGSGAGFPARSRWGISRNGR